MDDVLLGRVSWLSDRMTSSIIARVQWCDARGMGADGRAEGSVNRRMLLEVMVGHQSYQFYLSPTRATATPASAFSQEMVLLPCLSDSAICWQRQWGLMLVG